MISILYDKAITLQVLGSLIKNPNLLIESKYDISEKDFADRFHKIIFGAIKNLFLKGIKKITPIEIDTYLSTFAVQKKIFDDNNGMAYVENLITFSKTENFDYNYSTLKKYTLLRELQKQGIDTSDYFNDNLVDPQKIEDMMSKFNQMDTNDILQKVEEKIVKVKDEFYNMNDEAEQHISKGMKDLIESFKLSPDIGAPLNGEILNTICRGARKKKLYLDSRPSGCFKSRDKLANCAKVSIPYYYDTEKKAWICTGYNEPALFITTELEIGEIQTMLISYVTGISEDVVLGYSYTKEQKEIIEQGLAYIKQSNMYIARLPNYSIEDIERTLKKHKILHNVQYVYFDYIFTTPKILQELSRQSRGMKLREDNVLLNLITVLKDLCNELDIFLSTSTQVSDGWQNSKHPDSSLIRNCKSLADKADIAYIGLPPSEEELSLIEPILNTGWYKTPNMCYHIYKVRRGSYNKVKLFVYFDAATCRTYEQFATNNNCEFLEISGTNIEKVLDDTITQIDETEPTDNIDGEGVDIPW